jgi:hypothetical protein
MHRQGIGIRPSTPLPQESYVLDRQILGNEPSVTKHNLTSGSSAVVPGRYDDDNRVRHIRPPTEQLLQWIEKKLAGTSTMQGNDHRHGGLGAGQDVRQGLDRGG